MSQPDPGPGKPVSASISEYSELALPTDANGLGNVLGGKVMHLVDLAGAMAAMRHARKPVVTASFDHMNFLHPIPASAGLTDSPFPSTVRTTSPRHTTSVPARPAISAGNTRLISN